LNSGAIAALNSDKSGLTSMNVIYKKRRILTEQLAEKLLQSIQRELAYLFGLNYQKE
jgi:hypothetical protein